ncbi:flagellar biosynthesis protein FlgA [Bradyrhizobium genosp. SA-3]|uniref:NAD(P)H-dependent oxidoreductase n=1 Tax=unclassified Bradyrhizobium TaxID=2631580 RepID=UPI00088BF884|nr:MULTISPECIES: Gfo/Idh/MocA family oxidoreductase [unclassified Bradyrhizobium]RZN10199.1 flagellar biosynthesis protein FlgA [Bradyrhizobium genosp. SA-3]SDI03320.1 Predicted homoserine dehydrogenase, contains C-terminal SAF domain [Bradyrhizobium sp. Rc2d]
MNLHRMLLERKAAGKPVTIGLIGAGKFGLMFLSQVRQTDGMHLVGVADLNTARARAQLKLGCWPEEQYAATSIDDALKHGRTVVTDNADALITHPAIEVIIEATGDPGAGIRFAMKAIENGKHIVMVNVEADAVAGPILARKAKQAGVVYSLAWGDQPALIADHVDWARAAGFKVVAAGKGTRYHPTYHQSTPDTVWDILDKYMKIKDRNSINPKMFNSFVDGTKSGIEMTAVCNATGLHAQSEGLSFPPATRFEHAEICKPKSDGGMLEKSGVTEVTSSVYRDGSDVPQSLVMGTYVVFETDSAYSEECFREYSMLPDKTGKYASLYRPIHMIGLELGISVASAALRKEPTGAPIVFNSDVVATAKRKLKAGEMLDGEGGFCVWGKQTPADASLKQGYLPLGLAHHVKLKTDIEPGQRLRWEDVEYDPNSLAVRVRREMEAAFRQPNVAA